MVICAEMNAGSRIIMIDDIVNEMWRHHAIVNLSLAKNWAFDYACALGELLGVDYHSMPEGGYLRDQARRKMWELFDVVKSNYETNPTRRCNVTIVLQNIDPDEVARYEFNCGKYRWER